MLATLAIALLAGCRESTAPLIVRPQCVRGDLLGADMSVVGALRSSDCQVTGDNASTSYRYQDYRILLEQGEVYYFDLRADGAWVPVLELRRSDDASPQLLISGTESNGATLASRNSQLAFVAPALGRYILRIRALSGNGGAFTLQHRVCGGGSTVLGSTAGGSASGALTETDCVLRDSFLPEDSTRADLYRLDLVAGETRTIRIKTSGDAPFRPALRLQKYDFGDGSLREGLMSYATSDSLVITLESRTTGRFLMAVGSASADAVGEYMVAVSEPASSP